MHRDVRALRSAHRRRRCAGAAPGARRRHSLALAARQLGRQPPAHLGAERRRAGQHLVDPPGDLARLELPCALSGMAHDVAHAGQRVQRGRGSWNTGWIRRARRFWSDVVTTPVSLRRGRAPLAARSEQVDQRASGLHAPDSVHDARNDRPPAQKRMTSSTATDAMVGAPAGPPFTESLLRRR